MATALDVIKRSLRLLGALGEGETPTASEGADCLVALNAMLDSWWAKTLAVFYVQSESFTWTGAQAMRTMGPGGNFVTTRPSVIESIFQRDSSVDYEIRLIGRGEYDAIPDKTTQSTQIARIYPEYRAATVALYAYPVPSAAVTVYINSLARLQSFATLETDLSLPPGYERALAFNLAVEVSPEFSLQPSALVIRNAAGSLNVLKRANLKLSPLSTDMALMGSRRGAYDYHTGD
jgi:hypothetical protein